MPVMDEFKEERDKIKNQPLQKRLSYFWSYYKWYVLGGMLALIIGIYAIAEIVTHKEEALFGIVVNADVPGDEEAFASSFLEYAGLDPQKYRVSFNSSLTFIDQLSQSTIQARQTIMVYAASGDMDVAIMDELAFESYAYSELFSDLSVVLPEELFSSLEGNIYYRDNAVAREFNAALDTDESAEDIVFPDPFKPEEMKEPIPIGIDISGCEALQNAYSYPGKPVLLGLPATSGRTNTAIKFVEFLFANRL